MINSANLRDDLDAVTSVYLPESEWYQKLCWNNESLWILVFCFFSFFHNSSTEFRSTNFRSKSTTNRCSKSILVSWIEEWPWRMIFVLHFSFSGHYRNKKRGRIYRLLNRKSNYIKNVENVDFVDYTSINCRFSTPTKLPEIICLNIIVFNRENNSISTTSIKNVSLQKILSLIEYNKRFYPEPLFLSYSLATSSVRMPNATTSENLSDDIDNERLQRNTAVLDEDNL